MQQVKLLICGGREYQDYPHLHQKIDQFRKYIKDNFGQDLGSIIHGGAKGADTLAGKYALDNQLKHQVFPAQWDLHGKSAGPKRNAEMLAQDPHYVIGFFGGTGTKHMVNIAKAKGTMTWHITGYKK